MRSCTYRHSPAPVISGVALVARFRQCVRAGDDTEQGVGRDLGPLSVGSDLPFDNDRCVVGMH